MAKEKKEKSGNWFARHKFLTVVLAIVVIIILSQALGGGDDGKTGAVDKNGTAQSGSDGKKEYRFAERADKQEKDIELALKEGGMIDGMKVTTTAAKYKTSLSDFDKAASGKTYVVVTVQLENTGDETKPYNPFDFRVQTAGGQVLDPTIATIPTLNSGDLVAGGKVTGDVVFEVPAEKDHQYLIWKPGLDSDRVIVQLQ